MKQAILALAVDAATSKNSGAFDLGDLRDYSIQVNFSGSTLAGTLKLQAIVGDAEYANADWVDIASSSQAITSAASHIWNVTGASYKFVRAVWTASSGTGTMTVTLFVKETVVVGV